MRVMGSQFISTNCDEGERVIFPDAERLLMPYLAPLPLCLG